ncbi:hypothetical protein HUG10_16830 [Halorarum halophilum]|uniref:Uncharacterized protein n=1 Tax=Halorarum halophilum TaxID=2743090 RepID=A0A7D5GJQ7_9EURY|nr:hypothetical protein [Halobaculum halophilum]QLG29091.1 hypothetical protein HUG10_16830 [Halobaculum halophilum]
MPDTKRGRERQGRKKREQLERRLNRREVETIDDEDEPEYPPTELEADLLSADAEADD